MAVKVKLEANPLQPGRFKLRALRGPELSEAELVESIMSASTLTEAEVRGVDSRRRELLVNALANNRSVVIPGLGRLAISLGGSFGDAAAVVNKDNVDVRVNLNVDDDLITDILQKLELETVTAPARQPVVVAVSDAVSGIQDHYAAGEVLKIRGDNLAILDNDQVDQGVFLTPADGGPALKLERLAVNSSTELMVLVPVSISGAQRLSVATRYTEDGTRRVTEYPNLLLPL